MLVRWNDPFRELQKVQNEVNRLFNTGLRGGRPLDDDDVRFSWSPAVDVAETNDHLTFTVEVPGFRQEELTLRVEGGVLTLEGERRFEEEKKDKAWHRVERSYGKFVRSFTLPGNVDTDRVNASLVDGILTIELAKRDEAKPKSIPIGSSKTIAPKKAA